MAVTYVAVAFVGLQTVNLLIPATTLPGWADQLFLGFVILGFPVSVVVAWAFELTADGMRRTETPEGEESFAAGSQLLGLALVVLVAAGVWYWRAGWREQPTTETTAVRDTGTPTASATGDTTDPPRLAVLPFENIARDTSDAFFARGMHEEVLNQLSKVSNLEVMSRTSVVQYAETNKTVREISIELGGVDALLEGSVRRAPGQVRITTQLIAAPEDEDLWANAYERQLSPQAIFDIQADIAQQIALALETELAEGERQRIESAPTDDMAAYEAYLRGRDGFFQAWATQVPADIHRSVESLREAVRRDSSFAVAHAWLALAHTNRSIAGSGERWLDSASAAVERARAIDPNLAVAHLAQAEIYRYRIREARGFGLISDRVAALRRAMELQPSHAFAHSSLADALGAQGEQVEAVRMAREAVQVAPRQPIILQEMADQLRAVGLYDESEAWDRRVLEIEPGHFEAIRGLALTQLRRGRPGAALEIWKGYKEKTDRRSLFALESLAETALAAGQPSRAKAALQQISRKPRRRYQEGTQASSEARPADLSYRLLGLTEVRLGNQERGREMLRQSADSLRVKLSERDTMPDTVEGLPEAKFGLAQVLAALGQSDEALELLEVAELAGSGLGILSYGTGLNSPFFDHIRSDARFRKIVGAVATRRHKSREEVRQLGIDLYPPGAEPDSAGQAESVSR